MDTQINSSGEELNASVNNWLHTHMRDLMPWVANVFVVAANKARNSPEGFSFPGGANYMAVKKSHHANLE